MWTRFICLFFLATLGVSRNATAQTDSGMSQRFQTSDFVLQTPDGWARLEEPTSNLTLLAPMPATGVAFRDNIRIKKHLSEGFTDVEKILSKQVKIVGKKYKIYGSGMLGSGEPRMAWFACGNKQTPEGQLDLIMIDYMVLNGEYAYALHAICEKSKFAKRRPTFDAIALSLKFKRPAPVSINAPAVNRRAKRSQAFEQGRVIGRYTFYIIAGVGGAWLAVIGGWMIFRKINGSRS